MRMDKALQVREYSQTTLMHIEKHKYRVINEIISQNEVEHWNADIAAVILKELSNLGLEAKIVIAKRTYRNPVDPEWTEWIEVNGQKVGLDDSFDFYFDPIFEVSLL